MTAESPHDQKEKKRIVSHTTAAIGRQSETIMVSHGWLAYHDYLHPNYIKNGRNSENSFLSNYYLELSLFLSFSEWIVIAHFSMPNV